MHEEMAALEADLVKKFDLLCSIYDHPAYFISEHFFDLRNAIDYDAERILARESDQNGEVAVGVNEQRAEFIKTLMKLEAKIISQIIPEKTSSRDTYDCLKQSIDCFMKISSRDLYEDAYTSLVLKIFDETNQLLKGLSSNQTVLYFSSKKEKRLGTLVHLKDDYLTREETSILKSLGKGEFDVNTIHHEILKNLNRSLLVGVSRPFVLTKSMFIVVWLGNLLRSDIDIDCKYICFGNATDSEFGFSINDSTLEDFILQEYRLMAENLNDIGIEGFDEIENTFKHFGDEHKKLIALGENRLRRLDSQTFCPAECTQVINLSYNQLETFDSSPIAKCVNLRALWLLNSYVPTIKLNLGFLASLSNLVCFDFNMPDSSLDFDVLKYLISLEVLRMQGRRKSSRLTEKEFNQVAVLPCLHELALHYFELETRNANLLKGFRKLKTLDLSYNRIGEIHKDLFNNCPSRLQILRLDCNHLSGLEPLMFAWQGDLKELCLDRNKICYLGFCCFGGLNRLNTLALSNNDILELPNGIFDSLVRLEKLDLGYNRLGFIAQSLFGKLRKLIALNLDNNPIQDIETYAFFRQRNLQILNLDNCNLKSIDDTMFGGLESLRTLSLANNQIEKILVLREIEAPRSVTTSANLSSEDLKLVANELFRDLGYLKRLSLRGNKLTVLDLNIFQNLQDLKKLDLSYNNITKLNSITEENSFNFQNLTDLNLANNQLTWIENGAFSRANELIQLNLSNNKLKSFSEDFFSNFPRLRIVELQNNSLTMRISKETFSEYSHITALNLLDNTNVTIEDDAFLHYARLNSLKLDLLRGFVGLPFRHLQNMIRYEDLYRNADGDHDEDEMLESDNDSDSDHESSSESDEEKMDDDDDDDGKIPVFASIGSEMAFTPAEIHFQLKEHAFENSRFKQLTLNKSDSVTLKLFLNSGENQAAFANIKVLALTNSSLRSLEGFDLAKSFTSLTELDLSNNKFTTIESNWFQNLNSLSKLSLSENLIEILDQPGLFENLPELKTINLSGNKLKHIHRRLYKSLFQLESLDISKNQLSNADFGFFRDLFNLKELDISYNNIVFFYFRRLLTSCRLLTILKASHNQLDHVSINEQSMSLTTGLKELDLSYNQLENMDFTRTLTRLERLDLSFNRIDPSVREDNLNLNVRLHSGPSGPFEGRSIRHEIKSDRIQHKKRFLPDQNRIMIDSYDSDLSDHSELSM